MARTVAQIFDSIKTAYVSERAAAGLPVDNPALWSVTNMKKIIFSVIAICAFALENYFDIHLFETNENIKKNKPPTRQWYAELVKNYQHGFPVIAGTDQFNNTNYTDAQIAASKQVKYCAVIKQVNNAGRVKLRIKTAGFNGTDLVQTPGPVVTGLIAYLDKAAPAGDNWQVEGNVADRIKMKWRIYYDPLIISATGDRLDGSATQPARAAIKEFLVTGMPFSGLYVPTYHIDAVQKVPGMKVPLILEAQTAYGLFPFTSVGAQYNPDAGWIRFLNDADLIVEYLPYTEE